jgi:hypothetical protein
VLERLGRNVKSGSFAITRVTARMIVAEAATDQVTGTLLRMHERGETIP